MILLEVLLGSFCSCPPLIIPDHSQLLNWAGLLVLFQIGLYVIVFELRRRVFRGRCRVASGGRFASWIDRWWGRLVRWRRFSDGRLTPATQNSARRFSWTRFFDWPPLANGFSANRRETRTNHQLCRAFVLALAWLCWESADRRPLRSDLGAETGQLHVATGGRWSRSGRGILTETFTARPGIHTHSST